MTELALIDTNVLVYRYDTRFPKKQAAAESLLRTGLEDNSVRLAQQSITQFLAAVTRGSQAGTAILRPQDAVIEAEGLVRQFQVIYPDSRTLQTAFRGLATYGFSWWDAQMWAYAEVHGLPTLYSEDFQHGRWYGKVRVVNPFEGLN